MITLRAALFQVLGLLTRRHKHLTLLLIDAVLPVLILGFAVLVIGGDSRTLFRGVALWVTLPLMIGVAAVISHKLGISRVQLKSYESTAIQLTAVYAAAMTGLVVAMGVATPPGLPLEGVVIYGLALFVSAVAIRVAMLHVLLWVLRHGQPKRRVLIYGAGMTGAQLAAALRSHERIVPVGFVDDNIALHNMTVAGLRVYPAAGLAELVGRLDVQRIILAMPSLSAPKVGALTRRLRQIGLNVQVLPSFAQLVGEDELIDTLAPVAPAQLLGRDQLGDSLPHAAEVYAGRTIMVSGAGGSVGSELCRQLLSCRPSRLVLYEVSEAALYLIDKELAELAEGSGVEIVPVLGSVTDSRLTRMVIRQHGVHVIFHAAAYKHVPLVEMNPIPGLANNVLGTRTLADAANDLGVKRFILISSDKAVRPTNVMGASKRLAELVVQDMAKRSKGTIFSMVRFGNVLGSSGSVIPLFKEQIARGGPVTLTHADVTRFFMTITEAARLVLLAGSFSDPAKARGGDVFVLDMGQPVRIRDLAVQLIHAAGYTVRDAGNPDGDIDIVVTGLRPGEKLHEELLIGEGLLTTPHPKILRAQEASLTELEMAGALRQLRSAMAVGDAAAAIELIRATVEGYCPAHEIAAQ